MRTVGRDGGLGGGRGRVNPPPGACFGGLGGLEGLKLSDCIYTPGGQRPRRIENRRVEIESVFFSYFVAPSRLSGNREANSIRRGLWPLGV